MFGLIWKLVFDSLVQREIEGWNSNDNSDSDKSSVHSSDGSSRRTSTLQSESDETFQVYGRGKHAQNRLQFRFMMFICFFFFIVFVCRISE